MNKPLKKAPIREQIHDIIKTGIIDGKYPPGDKISITALSKELQVSNSPVREAVSMLEWDGLVDIYPNSGPLVIKASAQRFSHITQTILAILLGTFEICLQTKKTEQLISLLKRALKEETDHLHADTVQEYLCYFTNFESAFVESCDNPYMMKHYTNMNDLFRFVISNREEQPDRNGILIAHGRILNAIEAGDYGTAKELLSQFYNQFQQNAN